jgi:hypothetical protein
VHDQEDRNSLQHEHRSVHPHVQEQGGEDCHEVQVNEWGCLKVVAAEVDLPLAKHHFEIVVLLHRALMRILVMQVAEVL